jgi:ABC-type antimicrobial peptide transport system permease subunit
MFFTYLRRELRRRRRAAIVVALGLALGIGLVITVSSVSTGMRDAQDKVLKSLYGVGTDLTVSKEAKEGSGPGERPALKFSQQGDGTDKKSNEFVVPSGGFQTLDQSKVASVARQNGVAAAVGGLSLNVNKLNGKFDFKPGERTIRKTIHDGGGLRGRFGGGGGGSSTTESRTPGSGSADFKLDSYSLFGVDVGNLSVGPMSSSKITQGKGFTASQADAKVAVVDSGYAKQQKLKVGGTLTIKGDKYAIIGIATADTGQSDANVYVPLERAQALSDLDMKNKVSTVYVKATSAKKIDSVKAAIKKNVSGTTVTSSSDLADQVSGSLSTASDLATKIGKWLSVAVLVAAFLIAGLLTNSAVTRRVREFGTLKALGWRSGRVVRQVIGEAFTNGVLGGALGIALGIGGALAVTAVAPTLTANVSPGGGRSFGGGPGGGFRAAGGAASKTVDIALSAPVTATTIALAVALAVLGGLIAGSFGGWRASRLRPADALRRVE